MLVIGLTFGATHAHAGPAIVVVSDATDATTAQRTVTLLYQSPYGRMLPIVVNAPAQREIALPWVWRLAPSFWTSADRCLPFVHDEPARWQFVYSCAQIDNRSGHQGDHAFADPASIATALALRSQIESILGIGVTREALVGSSASGTNALMAVIQAPRRFDRVAIADAPVDLAARYWQIAPAKQRRTAPDYGGPPTGSRRPLYQARSPISHVAVLAQSPTVISWMMSRSDRATCAPAQWPTFIAAFARVRHAAVKVAIGSWQHGTGWLDYGDYLGSQLQLHAAGSDDMVPPARTVTSRTAGRGLHCLR